MILHCTLPYRQDIPNPALGYLKGFLQAHSVPVTAVYWNVALTRTVYNFHGKLERYSEETGLSSIPGITLFLSRHLFTGFDSTPTPISQIYASVFTRKELSDTVNSLKSEIDQFIRTNNLDKAPFSGFSLKSYQWPMSLYIINRLKDMNPDTKVVIGGIYNEEQARTFLQVFSQVDYAIWGEGEYPLLHLVRAVKEGTSLDAVPQLVFRDGKKCVATTTQIECPSLDEYPFADHTDYFALTKSSPKMSVSIPIWGSRSCPWNKCKFCALNENYQYRTRSPHNVVEEIEYQSKKHKCDSFIFVDTELPGNKKRFKTLLQMLMESSSARKKPYHFYAEVSPVFITDETAHYMRRISFRAVQIGFEAMTDTLLEKMQKRHRFAHNIQALKAGNKNGLKISGLNIIRGIPTETEEDVKESCANATFLRFLLNTYPLLPNFFSLEKGSPFHEEMDESTREMWTENPYWAEIAPTTLIDGIDRFELFGFCAASPSHYHNWDIFSRVMMSLKSQNRSYEWIEYEDGSFLEEKGPKTYRYTLDRDETDILIFCDSIRHFKELKEEFSHITEDDLRTILHTFKEAGILYYDKDMRTIISVVEACKRRTEK